MRAALWRLGAALSPRRLSHHILGTAVSLLLLLHLGNAALILHFYATNAAREQDAREARAALLAEHASRAFGSIVLALESIRGKLPEDFATRQPSPEIQRLLEERIRLMPQIRAFAIVDAKGMRVYDSRIFPAPPITVPRGDNFGQGPVPPTAFYVGATRISHLDGKPFFVVSIPVVDSGHALSGVIAALGDPDYFSSFYGARDLEAGESAILMRTDGAVLAGTEPRPELFHPLALPFKLWPQTGTLRRPVPSFPLEIVLSSASPAASPAFQNLILADGSAMLVLTLAALWFARELASEAAARDKAETRLREAIACAPAGIALFDAEDRLLLCNDIFRSTFPAAQAPLITPGIRFETLLTTATSAVVDEPENAETRGFRAQRLAAHRAAAGEIVQKLPNGRWFLTCERPTKEGGIVCFHTDITPVKQQEEALRRSEQAERLARERAERADQAKSTFLATMSHELRTPLNAVIGFAEILEKQVFGPVPPRYSEYGELIRRSGEHLLAIIGDILDLAKLQSGKTELQLEPVAVDELIERTLRLMAEQAAAAELGLGSNIEPDLPKITADPTRLRQVLLNLLSNAIKFTPARGRVTVTARRNAGALEIAVSDTGIGMGASDIPKALEPFGQVANAMTRTHQGTGLGLPLSKSLVELHGGSFAISSAPHRGTTITILLPLAGAESPRSDRATV